MSVGNFHISNGAAAWRLNLLGDTSQNGMQNSLGTMINYRYDLDEIERRAHVYANEGKIDFGESFRDSLSELRDELKVNETQ